MINTELSLAVAKVLIAAAWVDGVVQPAEENFLRDFISRMPGIDENTWTDLQPMIERPVYEAERIRYLRDMRNQISDQKDRRFAIQAINQLFIADGEIAPEEEDAVRQMVSIINGDESAVYTEMLKMIQRLAY
ncbi:MAG: TerB family tellurite resistance protein [Puniceicoccales bacterium]